MGNSAVKCWGVVTLLWVHTFTSCLPADMGKTLCYDCYVYITIFFPCKHTEHSTAEFVDHHRRCEPVGEFVARKVELVDPHAVGWPWFVGKKITNVRTGPSSNVWQGGMLLPKFLPVLNFFPKNTKCVAGSPPFWGNLAFMGNIVILNIHICSVGNLQLCVGKMQFLNLCSTFLTHDAADPPQF